MTLTHQVWLDTLTGHIVTRILTHFRFLEAPKVENKAVVTK